MSDEVAIRTRQMADAVMHETDEDGRPACRMGDQDITFRTFERSELPEDMRECSWCADRTFQKGGDGGKLVRRLEDPNVSAPEDLEEVSP